MIPAYLPVSWAAIARALGDHLWQSTLFTGTAGLLTLLLRRNYARARYWLWLAASVKFLIPFSLLVAAGSYLASSLGSTGTRTGLYFAMEEVGQPFTQPTMSLVSRTTSSTASLSLIHLLPLLLAAVWLCGFVAVIFVWYLRWRRISSAVRKAVPLRKGREAETLRRLGSIGGTRKPIEILLSRTSLEPGIFGIARPVLIWPEGISARLEDAHLEAILAHELWHVRRRDNLAAAIHMLVEAIFWFYPLVWWLGARLVAERERACDEEVLASGSDRQVYAESILKICEFCLGSPLACVSGVTGSDLKRRMVYIMTNSAARKLDFSRKLLLSVAAFAAVAAPIVFGLVNATPSRAQLLPAKVRAQAKPATDADIVARVNNDVITLSDYQKAEQRLRDELAHDCQGCPQDKIDAQFKERQQDLLRGMIDQSLMVQRAKDMGISVESDLAKRLNEVRKQNGLASIDDLQKGVEASGLSWEDYKTTVRKGLLQKELVQREVGSHVDISSDEVKQYYEAHPQEFTLPERVTLSEISLSTEGKNPEELAAVRAKVEGLRTSILNGDDFNRVAQLYSQGSTAKDGGHLGTYKKGEVSPQIEAIVFQMRKDQISDVIQTRTRFEVLKVEDHLQPGLQPLDKVQADILNTIRAQKMQPRMRDYLAELRKQSKIIVTPGYHDSALLSGSNVPSPDQSQSQDQNTAHIVPAYESVLIRPNTTGEAMPPFKITGKPVHGILLKPDRFMATNETLQMLIQLAYDLQETQISGGPAWFNSENYDVDVKMDKSAIDELQKLSPDQRFPEQKRIIQALLTDRFKLALHRETRDLPVHELLIANGDSKLQQAKPGDTYSDGLKGLGDRPAGPGIWIPENGQLIGQGVPIVLLVRVLSEKLGGQIVVDKTGLTGNYDFTIKWAPDASQPPTGSRQGTVPPESLASAISSALQQQLGLKLEVQQAPVEVLVIDDAEQPTQN